MNDVKLVYVQWEDTVRPHPDWKILSEESKDDWADVVMCASVGWLVHETERVVVVMPNLGNVGGESVQGCGEIRIPKSCIIQMTRLKEPNLKRPKS